MNGFGHAFENAGKLGLGVGVEGVAGPLRGGLLRLLTPCRQPLWRRSIEEQREAEQLFDFRFDLGPQHGDDLAQPFGLLRAVFERLQVVADGLLARDRGK